jgi:hypothetical protein
MRSNKSNTLLGLYAMSMAMAADTDYIPRDLGKTPPPRSKRKKMRARVAEVAEVRAQQVQKRRKQNKAAGKARRKSK